MKPPVWLAVVGGALLAPLVTWLPMLAARVPWLGLPPYPPAQGIDLWSAQAFWLCALTAAAIVVGHSDRWLGAAVGLAGLTVFLRGAFLDPTQSVIFAAGALLLVSVRAIPTEWIPIVRLCVVGMAGLQGLYAVQQYLGYDLLWGPLLGGVLIATPQMLGTLGTVNAAAGYLAIVAPLMPWPMLLPVAGIVWLSHSLGASAALLVGLVVRYRAYPLAWIGGAGALAYAAFELHKQTHVARVAIWRFGLSQWITTDPILGFGLGGWAQRIPALQVKLGVAPTPELWQEAHNEPLQWLIETGVVGLALLVCWLWTHRAMFTHPVWGGSVAALAADSLTWFPFHIVSMALLGLLVVGLASRPKELPCAVA